MSTRTELEKLSIVYDQKQACEEFLEWLGQQGYKLAEYHTHGESCTYIERKDIFDINDGWSCGYSVNTLYPISVSARKLTAQFFGIDEVKLENERRALLRSLR